MEEQEVEYESVDDRNGSWLFKIDVDSSVEKAQRLSNSYFRIQDKRYALADGYQYFINVYRLLASLGQIEHYIRTGIVDDSFDLSIWCIHKLNFDVLCPYKKDTISLFLYDRTSAALSVVQISSYANPKTLKATRL